MFKPFVRFIIFEYPCVYVKLKNFIAMEYAIPSEILKKYMPTSFSDKRVEKPKLIKRTR